MRSSFRMSAALGALLVLAACATTTASQQPAAAMARAAGSSAANPAAARDSGCLATTESPIARSADGCSSFGRSYSEEDLRRTGRLPVTDALPLMDPALTIHH
jgi:hypothetical protein